MVVNRFMAVYYNYISGGGDALNNSLSGGGIHDGIHINYFILDDGVYDPIDLSTGLITNNRTSVIISSANGPNNCIIDGGTTWENDIFNGTLISAGTRCFDSYKLRVTFTLSCIGITFRNGYAVDGSAFLFYTATGKHLNQCVIKNMYGSSSYGSIVSSYSGNTMVENKTIVRNVVGKNNPLGIRTSYNDCLVENITATYLLNSSNNFLNSIARNCKLSRISRYGKDSYNNLFYNLSTSSNELFDLQRDSVYNNTFVITPTANITCFSSFNQTHSIFVTNNIFATTNGKKITIGTTRSGTALSVCNNYAPAYTGGNQIDCLTGNDPGFISAEIENFHLAKTSPCISAGNYSYVQTAKDIDNNTYKNPPSIGCYQYIQKLSQLPNYEHPCGI